MNAQQLQQVESLSEKAYSSQNQAERSQAEEALKIFSSSPEYHVQCRFILDNSSSPYAQILASSSLMKSLSNNWSNFTVQQRIDIRIHHVLFAGC